MSGHSMVKFNFPFKKPMEGSFSFENDLLEIQTPKKKLLSKMTLALEEQLCLKDNKITHRACTGLYTHNLSICDYYSSK